MRQSKHLTNRRANPWTASQPAPPQKPTTTIIIPTASDSPTLMSVVDSHHRQTEPHATIIVDTTPGETEPNYWIEDTPLAKRPRFMAIRPLDNQPICSVITEAIDAAIAIATTKWIFLTHDDVWLKRENFLTELVALATTEHVPVVGYEMSPRDHVTEEWKGMVSHTATLLHRETINRLQLRWNFTDALNATPEAERNKGWPDTETNFGRNLKIWSITPRWIGHETNEQHFEDHNIVHRRSLTSHRTHAGLGLISDQPWIDRQVKRFRDLN